MQRRRSMPHLFPRNRYEHRAGLRLSGLGEAERPGFRDRCSLKWPVWGQAMGRCDPNRALDLSRDLSHGRFRGRFRGLSRSMSRGLPVVCPWSARGLPVVCPWSVPRQTTH
jgi:hypothetical protein